MALNRIFCGLRKLALLILACIIAGSCHNNYIYIDEIENILCVDMGKCIEKRQFSSDAIGEWYICETYSFEKYKDFSQIHNALYTADTSWIRQDWKILPIDSSYLEIHNTIFNYYGTDKTKIIANEMEKQNDSGNGYYSFLVKPSIRDPQYVIMCIIDTNNMKLYIVDTHI